MRRYTTQEVRDFLFGNGIVLHGEYIGNKSKMNLTCFCGKPFKKDLSTMKTSGLFMCNDCCKKVEIKKRTTDFESVKNFIESNGYSLLSTKDDYKNTLTYLMVFCNNKNHKPYPTTFQNFKKGSRCQLCYHEKTRERLLIPFEEMEEFLDFIGYKMLSPKEIYENVKSMIDVECDKGHFYETNLNRLRNNQRCPHCSETKGEREISNLLNEWEVQCLKQHRFDDCRLNQPLPFDFYLPDYKLCIEYDGIQHFEPVDFFGGEEGFISRKIRDTVKGHYCKTNGIELIRIPYWDFDNIEKILRKKILKQDDTEVIEEIKRSSTP